MLTPLSRLLALLKAVARSVGTCALQPKATNNVKPTAILNSLLINNVESSVFFTYFYFIAAKLTTGLILL
jgi:hypothetical protein